MHSKFILYAFKLQLSAMRSPSWTFTSRIKEKKRRKASVVIKHWSRITNQTEKPRCSFILFVTVVHSYFNIHINKLLNLRLEVQKKPKNGIILKLSGTESLEPRHFRWFCTGGRSTFPALCLSHKRCGYTSQLTDCSVHHHSNCYNPLVGCRLSSRTWCPPFCEALSKPPTIQCSLHLQLGCK